MVSLDGKEPKILIYHTHTTEAYLQTDKDKYEESGKWRNPNDANNMPIPGDYVFFDWDRGSDPDHVGAVLCVKGGFLYTIEGNSGGKVAVQRYLLSDSRIVGYGVLNWKTGKETTE